MEATVTPAPEPPVSLEAERVRRAQNGDVEAFESLYRSHVGRVHALCLRLAADRGTADELTQDVFVRAWRKLRSFRGESAFGSWLHRLAVNTVLGELRARRRHARRHVSGEGSPEPMATTGVADRAHLDLERAVASLPPKARVVFVLYDVEGYRHEEIAELTGVAVGTSKAHLHRARRLLRDHLTRGGKTSGARP